MKTLRYYIYLRKSSESEERQELSILAQSRELNALVEKQKLAVIGKPFEESMSAKEPGRPIFNRLIKQVCSGQADGILCWKLDRLARNPIDGGQIMYALGKGRIKEIVTPNRTYTGTGDDKLLMSIIFGMATKYSDDLSDNVKRGNRETLEMGRWPGKPKVGYRRDHESMKLIEDPDRFQLVRDIWQMLLAGTRPLEAYRIANEELGLATPINGRIGGKPLAKSQFYKMLRDPFYAGVMIRKGEAYTGNHPKMISMDDFELVQSILDGNVRPLAKPQRLWFTYRGLIFCGRCNAVVTAKNTINRHGSKYTYYYCCRKEKRYKYCPEKAVQECHIQSELQSKLYHFPPPRDWASSLLRFLDGYLRKDGKSLKQRIEYLTKSSESKDRQLARLRDFLSRDLISENDFQTDRKRLLKERQKIQDNLNRVENSVELVEPHRQAIIWLNQAGNLFRNGDDKEKRKVMDALTWNLQLKSKKVLVLAKKPYSYIGAWSRFPTESAWIDYIGTQINTSTYRTEEHSLQLDLE